MKYILINLLLTTLVISCHTESKSENPYEVSRAYCNCVMDRLLNAKDSSVNINECSPVFFYSSRFMMIHQEQDYEKYSKATLDSAMNFYYLVGNIIDTMCLDKIDTKKLIKVPHAKM